MSVADDEPWPSAQGHTRLAGRVEIVDGPFDETALTATYDGVDIDDVECRVVLWRRGATAEALAERGPELAAIRHPHVLPIVAAGYDADLDVGFLAEAVSELPLRDALDDFGPLPQAYLPLVGWAAAEGLAAVHEQGLAHSHLSLGCLHVVAGHDETAVMLGGLGHGLVPDDLVAAQRADVEALVSLLRRLDVGAATELPAGLEGLDTASELVAALKEVPRAEGSAFVVPWREQAVDALAKTVLTGRGTTSIAEDPTVAAASSPLSSGPGRYAPLSSASLLGLEIGGRFRLERLLGEGGMGAVYEAVQPSGDTETPERVAIKIIRPGAATGEAAKRFVQEARLSRELESDHTVRVFAVGHDTLLDAPFMVMELLVGQDLRQLADEVSPLPPAVAVRIVREAAVGLSEAHDRGLIHRDIKPSNIFLHERGTSLVTKICDFGVAKLVEPEAGATKLTRTGGLLGSPAYMSPEQARDSKRADARADVWSLGVTLYELLSGKHPWHGAGDLTELLVWLQIRDPVPLRQVAPWVEPELCDIVHRALARMVDERYSDAGALATALEPHTGPRLERDQLTAVAPDLLAQAKPATPTMAALADSPPPTGPRRRWLGVVAAAVLAGAVAWGVSRPSAPIASGPVPPAPTTATTCSSARECTKELGVPATCQEELGCVALESEHCRLEDDGSDPALNHDDTLWVGTMFPGEETDQEIAFYGAEARKAIDLARADFMSQAGGLLATKSRPARPIGLIHCDDTNEPERVAEHLVEVGVRAVIGFSSSKQVVTLASRHFIPSDVLVVPAINMGAQIDKIPHPPDSPRLVWRTVASQTATAAVADTLISEFIEPGLRAQRGGGPIRVAVARDDSAVGVALGQELFTQLRFNGASITENGDSFRQVVGAKGTSPQDTAAELASFDPDVVLLAGSMNDELIHALETPTPRTTRYIFMGDLLPTSLPTVAASAPGALSRIYGVLAASSPTNDRYAMHFNAAYKTKVTPDNTMATPYDAFYLIAYAAYAQPEGASGGSGLARGIGRLVPPGEPIEVGPRDILTAFSLLGRGKNIDLTGTYGPMDFDARTGSASPKWNVVCPVVSPDEPERVIATPTGLMLDSDGSFLSGELRCPAPP